MPRQRLKDCMSSILHRGRVNIDVADVLVSGGVSNKDTSEIMSIKFGSSVAGLFDTYTGAKSLQPLEIRALSIPRFERRFLGSAMAAPIEQERCMDKGRRPINSRETRTIEESASDFGKRSIKTFNTTILNRCIRSSGFNDIAVFRQFITEVMGSGKFTAKICSDHTSGFETIFLEKKVDQFNRGMFRTTQ